MKVLRSSKKAFERCVAVKRKGKIVGLVPTMGALHEGHVSLIRKCRKKCDFLVVSIFVNPAQFGPSEDFGTYPKNFKRDAEICRANGVDLIFNPSVKEMYPGGFETYVNLERLPNHLCGLKRPGHFRGVATVVLKLFNIIQPDIAVFGKKDYQQFRVIKKMTGDLNVPVRIIAGDTIRAKSGLAVSSRNRYLSPAEIKNAALLRKALLAGRGIAKKNKSSGVIKKKIKIMLKKTKGKIDYVSVCDRETLEELGKIKGRCLMAIAVKIGRARLIDNIET